MSDITKVIGVGLFSAETEVIGVGESTGPVAQRSAVSGPTFSARSEPLGSLGSSLRMREVREERAATAIHQGVPPPWEPPPFPSPFLCFEVHIAHRSASAPQRRPATCLKNLLGSAERLAPDARVLPGR